MCVRACVCDCECVFERERERERKRKRERERRQKNYHFTIGLKVVIRHRILGVSTMLKKKGGKVRVGFWLASACTYVCL